MEYVSYTVSQLFSQLISKFKVLNIYKFINYII
jgi:hypothetical protein